MVEQIHSKGKSKSEILQNYIRAYFSTKSFDNHQEKLLAWVQGLIQFGERYDTIHTAQKVKADKENHDMLMNS